jgi:hypothetical protein
MVDCRSKFGRAKAGKVRGKCCDSLVAWLVTGKIWFSLDKAKQGGLPRSATYENVLLSKVDG